MKLKKLITGIAIFLSVAASTFAKTKIVTTIFPEYDWVREIVGDKASEFELTLLIKNGTDLHSYRPSFQDIIKISEADIFIYVGGESDSWVKDVLKSAKNKDMIVINLMEQLGDKVKAEEFVEGMQHEHEDEHEHKHEHEHAENGHHHEHHHHDNEEEIENDEHVWLSVRFAKLFCNVIADSICKKDAANASVYKKNLSAYSAELDKLDQKFSETVKNSKKNVLLFGDRFPFRYFVDDYEIKYYAAFIGCSAETEASFDTVIFLAKKLDEHNLNAVCKIEKGNGKIAKTIIKSSKNKKAKIFTLDSMQSTTENDIKKGVGYLSIMQSNLEVIKEALN